MPATLTESEKKLWPHHTVDLPLSKPISGEVGHSNATIETTAMEEAIA